MTFLSQAVPLHALSRAAGDRDHGDGPGAAHVLEAGLAVHHHHAVQHARGVPREEPLRARDLTTMNPRTAHAAVGEVRTVRHVGIRQYELSATHSVTDNTKQTNMKAQADCFVRGGPRRLAVCVSERPRIRGGFPPPVVHLQGPQNKPSSNR